MAQITITNTSGTSVMTPSAGASSLYTLNDQLWLKNSLGSNILIGPISATNSLPLGTTLWSTLIWNGTGWQESNNISFDPLSPVNLVTSNTTNGLFYVTGTSLFFNGVIINSYNNIDTNGLITINSNYNGLGIFNNGTSNYSTIRSWSRTSENGTGTEIRQNENDLRILYNHQIGGGELLYSEFNINLTSINQKIYHGDEINPFTRNNEDIYLLQLDQNKINISTHNGLSGTGFNLTATSKYLTGSVELDATVFKRVNILEGWYAYHLAKFSDPVFNLGDLIYLNNDGIDITDTPNSGEYIITAIILDRLTNTISFISGASTPIGNPQVYPVIDLNQYLILAYILIEDGDTTNADLDISRFELNGVQINQNETLNYTVQKMNFNNASVSKGYMYYNNYVFNYEISFNINNNDLNYSKININSIELEVYFSCSDYTDYVNNLTIKYTGNENFFKYEEGLWVNSNLTIFNQAALCIGAVNSINGTFTIGGTGSLFILEDINDFTVYLPTSDFDSRYITIKKSGGNTNNIYVEGNSSLIEGTSSVLLNTGYDLLKLYGNGTAWLIL